MVNYCFVPQCTTFGSNGFHCFPADQERRNQWMIQTKTFHLGQTESAKICRKHFKDSDLITDIDGKKRLVPNAVPSLYLPRSSTLGWDHNYTLVSKTYT